MEDFGQYYYLPSASLSVSHLAVVGVCVYVSEREGGKQEPAEQ